MLSGCSCRTTLRVCLIGPVGAGRSGVWRVSARYLRSVRCRSDIGMFGAAELCLFLKRWMVYCQVLQIQLCNKLNAPFTVNIELMYRLNTL